MSGYKKEHASKKQQGLTAEHEADSIPFSLYSKISNYALSEGNIYAWCWTILQWNYVARSSSIDLLGFHNFSIGASDSIKVLYDESKADNKGKKLPLKIYTQTHLILKYAPFQV